MPRAFGQLQDKFPRSIDHVQSIRGTPMGKFNKRELRAPYWASGRTIGG